MINSPKLHKARRAFMRKHIFLLASVGMLTFMALATEKKVLVTTGYAITEEELALGHSVYQQSCQDCHENGTNGAPAVGNRQAWEAYLAKGIDKLLQNGAQQCSYNQQGELLNHRNLVSDQEIEAAIAFMIRRSRQ
jgi:cytochrome c5